MKHTPGPWTWTPAADKVSDSALFSVDITARANTPEVVEACGGAKYANDIGVARIFTLYPCGYETTDECVANAKLIAAAPALLEACKHGLEIIKLLNDGLKDTAVLISVHTGEPTRTVPTLPVESIKAAIAKAE